MGIFQSIHALANSGLPHKVLITQAAPLLTPMVEDSAPGLTKL
jgi:hypothetical protein